MKKKRGLFGPSKAEIWKQFSENVGGDFEVEKKFLSKTEKVYAYHKEWEICLDTFVVSTGNSHVTYTRFRAAYVYRDNFTFRIVRRNIFRDLGKKFGLQDIIVGHPKFDKDFIIQGTDERKLKMLFENWKLRALISKTEKHIEIKTEEDEGIFKNKYPDGINALSFIALGVIKDLDRLHTIYDIFAELLDQLYEIGTADPDNPEFSF
ncbi:MAG: DUF3137 domain-containing protein [Bacteroidota bacterium]